MEVNDCTTSILLHSSISKLVFILTLEVSHLMQFLYTITLPAPNFHTCRLASAIIRVQYRPTNSVTVDRFNPFYVGLWAILIRRCVWTSDLRGAQLKVVQDEHELKAAN